jgi:hypothetical protein
MKKNKFQIFARKSKNGGAMKKQVSNITRKSYTGGPMKKTIFKLSPANRKTVHLEVRLARSDKILT